VTGRCLILTFRPRFIASDVIRRESVLATWIGRLERSPSLPTIGLFGFYCSSADDLPLSTEAVMPEISAA
jgi:hypothetical protein